MRSILKISLMFFLVMVIGFFCPLRGQAQYLGLWPSIYPPFCPLFYVGRFNIFTGGYLGLPVFPPMISVSPFLVEPRLRAANAPATLTIPTVTTTTAPLTALLNLIDPAVLASNIAVLTTNYPLVYDLLVATFLLPI